MKRKTLFIFMLILSAGSSLVAQATVAKPFSLKPATLPVAVLVQDMERSRRFYAEVLQQVIKSDSPVYVTFEAFSLWQAESAANAIGHAIPASTGTDGFELVFESPDLDAVQARLKQANVKFVHEIKEMPWGQRVLRFYDPDGHMAEAGEPMEIVVRRFLKQGMSPEEVSRRTVVPLDEVKRIAAGQ